MPFLSPPLFWAFGAVGAAFIAKLLFKEWQRVNEQFERMATARATVDERAVAQRLMRDPLTGVYRPYTER